MMFNSVADWLIDCLMGFCETGSCEKRSKHEEDQGAVYLASIKRAGKRPFLKLRMDHPYGRQELRDMKPAAPQARDPGEPRGPRATNHQTPQVGDAAAATADALMHLSTNGDAARHNGGTNGSEKQQGKQQAQPSDQQQPTRVVRFITAYAPGKATNGNGAATHGAPPGVGLPPGWQRITHDSGLPCFVNTELQIVTWSKPYVLDAVGADFLTMATTHVPPLSLFSRRDVGPAPAQLANQLAAQPLRQPVEDPKPPLLQQQPRAPMVQAEQENGTRKRKAFEVNHVQREPPQVKLVRQGDALPLIEVNGELVPSPENKNVHTILKDFSVAAWGRCPQYNYNKTGERDLPIACCVRIGRQHYRTEKRITKFLAKDAAAEAVLHEFAPEYWAEWKKSGRVDLRLKAHEQQERQHKRHEARQEEARQKQPQNAPELKQPEPMQPERNDQAVNPQGQAEPPRGTAVEAANLNVQTIRSPERQIEQQVENRIEQMMRALRDQTGFVRGQFPEQPPRQPLPDRPARLWPDHQIPPPPRHASPPQIKQEPVQQIPPKAASSMTLEEFKTLSISDPRVLQARSRACLDLSIKTPAQVIQEYQNRHRGISVNYNTVPHEVGSEKVFKTIVTAGSTAAEGVGSSKKVSKQLAAQHLLQVLHERSATLYHEIADLYSRSNHVGGHAGQVVPVSARSSPSKKARRSPPVGSRVAAVPYGQGGQAYGHNGAARGWDGYAAYDGGQARAWQGSPPQEAGYGRKNERIVEYYSPPTAGYEGYYGNDPNGARGAAHPQDWGYARPMAPPPPQPPQRQQQYGVYGPGAYGAAPPRPSDPYREQPPPQAQQRLPYPYGPPHPPQPPQPRGAPYDRQKGAYR